MGEVRRMVEFSATRFLKGEALEYKYQERPTATAERLKSDFLKRQRPEGLQKWPFEGSAGCRARGREETPLVFRIHTKRGVRKRTDPRIHRAWTCRDEVGAAH